MSKIIKVSRVEYFFIETEGEDYRHFRRSVVNGSNDWEILMGESWESFNCCEEMEELFQEYVKNNQL